MREEQRFDRVSGMIEDRLAGMTYAEIGVKYGISRQRVGQIYGKYNKYNFKAIKESGCIYRNLRDWMNKNSVDRADLLRRIYGRPVELTAAAMQKFYAILVGRSPMPEEMAHRIAATTGITYEDILEIG